MYKIAIVEDDKPVREELKILLENAGYKAILIDLIENQPNQIEEQIIRENPHLILLDINLPGRSGYEICSKIRKQLTTPIIFVTSRNSSMDELNGLTLGGDDYIEKPYNVPVLFARIAALLKRTYPNQETNQLTYKGIELNTVTGIVTYQGKQIELTRTEFRIFYYLMKHKGEIVPRIDIVEYMWDNQLYVDDNTLSVNMTRIREKLAEIGIENLIETKRGLGYQLWN